MHTFLEEASNLFELYIYTMGSRRYALEMAKLLDPRENYFHSRIITRSDCTRKNQKSLDIFLGRESRVLTLDDKEAVSDLNSVTCESLQSVVIYLMLILVNSVELVS